MSVRLQAAPAVIDGTTVFLDLRRTYCTDLLLGARPERLERAAMRRLVKLGDVAFDIGAYFGLHTIVLSDRVGPDGRVYAFEPSPAVLPCLAETVRRLRNTLLLPVALAETQGVASFCVPAEASTASFADWTSQPAASKKLYQVPVENLDRLVFGGHVGLPDFIKCDVEGAEVLVFSGARALLDRDVAPILLFEMNPSAASAFGLETGAAVAFLKTLRNPRYSFYRLEESGQHQLDAVPDRFMNLLAVPAARQGCL